LRCCDKDLALLELVCRRSKIELGGIFADTGESLSALDNALLDE
jgi:hypothetical protein